MSDAAADTAMEERFRAPWRPAEWLMLAGGWALAVAAMLPGALGPDSGPERVSLAGALGFWPLAIWVMRSDLLHFLIPDEASASIAALGLLAAAGTPWLGGADAGEVGRAVEGAAACGAGAFALFWAVGAAFRALGRDALGHGDVKLAGACAVWLSPADAALALEVAAIAAAAALLLARRGAPLREAAVPFGAFLAPAAWAALVLASPLRDAGLLPW